MGRRRCARRHADSDEGHPLGGGFLRDGGARGGVDDGNDDDDGENDNYNDDEQQLVERRCQPSASHLAKFSDGAASLNDNDDDALTGSETERALATGKRASIQPTFSGQRSRRRPISR